MSRQSELGQFPTALRALIDAELAAGNEITEIRGGFPATPAGLNVKFTRIISTPLPAGVTYRDRPNNPLFGGEYTDAARHYFVLNPPAPPPPDPDMDAIRARHSCSAPPEHSFAPGFPPPMRAELTGAVARFGASRNLSYDNWREGDSYDLDAIAQASPSERSTIEAMLLSAGVNDWRDVEALAVINSPRTRALLERGLREAPIEIRLAILSYAPQLATPQRRTRVLIDAIESAAPYHGLTATISLITEHPTPSVRAALLRAVLHRPGEAAVHFAALLFFLYGKAESTFDWNHRPFFLRFHEADPALRAQVFRELCQTIGEDPAPYLAAPGEG